MFIYFAGVHYSHSVSEGSDALKVNTKTESMDVLSNRPSFQQLSSSEKEELRAMLDDDEEKMKLHFGRIDVYLWTACYLCVCDICLVLICAYLLLRL